MKIFERGGYAYSRGYIFSSLEYDIQPTGKEIGKTHLCELDGYSNELEEEGFGMPFKQFVFVLVGLEQKSGVQSILLCLNWQ